MVLSFESACSSVVCPNATPSTPITVSPLRSRPSFATADREDMRSTRLPVGDKVTGSRPLRSAGHSICSLSLDVSLSTKLSVIFTLPSSADSSVKPVSLWTKPASFRMFAQLFEALVDRAAAEYCIPGRGRRAGHTAKLAKLGRNRFRNTSLSLVRLPALTDFVCRCGLPAHPPVCVPLYSQT